MDKRMNRYLFVIATLALLAAPLHAAPSEKPAPNLVPEERFGLSTPNPQTATLERQLMLQERGGPGQAGPMLHVEVHHATDPFYEVQVTQTIEAVIPEGTRLRWRFWARSPTGNPMRAVIEKAGPPWTAVGETDVVLTPAWKLYTVDCTTRFAAPARGLGLRFQVGQQAGTIELAGVTLEDQGPDPRLAAARAAIEPAAIAARIEKYRKADLTVEVRDAAGHPVDHANVHVEQVRHAFLFGANIFMLQPQNHEAWQQEYQERFTALLNYATLPFYWGAFEPQAGQPQYARLDAMARWCQEHGITTKGHPLVWHEVYPAWAPPTADAAIPLLHARVHDIVTHYRGQVAYWDVLNEINNAAGSANHNGEAQWVARDGGPTVVATALGWARQALEAPPTADKPGDAPAAKLIYNDFNTGTQNLALLQALADRHALPDIIGIQSHMHDGTWPPEVVWQTAEDFARFGRPIHFTEVTVLSGPPRNDDPSHTATDWVTTPEGEAAQAQYVARFYSILFSHPAVRAITWWDLSDRGAWRGAPAGLVRKDMTPKPAYERLMALIHHEWWTDTQGRTGRDGRLTVRAFYGDYVVTVTGARGATTRKDVSLPMDGGDATVRVTLR